MKEMPLAAQIKRQALEVGFDLAGIAPISVWADLEFSRRWVNSGYAGEMRYLENPKRDDPRRIVPTVQSVVCVGLIYNTAFPYSTDAAVSAAVSDRKSQAEPRGWISRYAWGRDYHKVMRAKLEDLRRAIESMAPGAETRVYVDTGPVVERAFARYSGIGWMGKNTCLINERMGSWFFLGVILTNLSLGPELPSPDRCGSCTRCLQACPTGALKEPYVMDASRCIAYFTIEHKGPIPAQYRSAIGTNVFGCDICQDVCPWNSPSPESDASLNAPESDSRPSADGTSSGAVRAVLNSQRRKRPGVTRQREFEPIELDGAEPADSSFSTEAKAPGSTPLAGQRTRLFNPPLHALASVSESVFRRVFSDSPVKRAKYAGWLRNLCVVIGNSGDRRFVPWLERAAQHEEPMVREHATWAIQRLGGHS